MTTYTERYDGVTDRAGWASGPWDGEPDKVVWLDETTGLACQAKRNPSGNWCGYVGVPESHPWHGVGYSEHLPVECAEEADPDGYCHSHAPDALVDVHGGLTYAALCWGEDKPAEGICHVSAAGPVWWFGFDTAHAWDLSPGRDALYRSIGKPELARDDEVYRSLAYVESETTDLARQIAAVA